MPLRKLGRLRRARLSAAPMVLQPALGWRGRLWRWCCMLSVAAGIGGGAAYWGYLRGLESAAADLSSRVTDAQTNRSALDASRIREDTLHQQLRMAESARSALAQALAQAQQEAAQAREALAFFDSLLTSNDRASPARFAACEFEPRTGVRWRYRVLLVQGVDRTAELQGELLISVLLKDGAAQQQRMQASRQPVRMRHYQRIEGEITLPPGARPMQLEARFLAAGDARVVAQCQKKTGGV
ncbi:hypothetical protein N8I74_07620 [Chitiniphilus purpureus]|uniref:Uncharacterized protein n=1 Tax=Chitiniphilus purpureus TaxID=2981137 RepID=A0ABY6DR75_9NEIS|nr:DUF6776 family protein [Chitiniphilus sp. CD1]UXY16874.1 hypothetical protein N8I74_07620 [Chitiniphilus sp. CD1]